MIRGRWLLVGALAAGSPVAAQSPLAAADSALKACIAAADANNEKVAEETGDRAMKLFAPHVNQSQTAAAALTGQARVLSQCKIKFAGFMQQGELVFESIDLLTRSLQIDSMKFGTRFTLAMNYHGMPRFLGKTDDAVREFEWLVARTPAQNQIPEMATAYAYLGDLYKRQDKHDKAAATWQRGSELFPDDAELKSRLSAVKQKQTAAAPAPAPAAAAPAAATATAAAAAAAAAPPSPGVVALRPIVVEGGSYSVEDPRSATALRRMDVYTAPGGAADMLQVFQMMPGTTRATDGSDLYVRGGDPSEAPVFVDGARLFYAGTFESLNGGTFGVLDPAILKQAYFSAGGFSARYGNALSGVLDVETDGRPDVFSWRAGANLATAGATVRAPLTETTGAFVSTQATETSTMLRVHGRSGEYALAPRAGQGVLSYIWEPAPGRQVRVVGLSEADRMEAQVESHGYSGSLHATGATRMAALTGKWFSTNAQRGVRGALSFTERATRFQFGVLDRERDDRAVAVRVEGDYAPTSRLRVRAGSEASLLYTDASGVVPATEDLRPGAPVFQLEDASTSTHQVGGFVESEVRISRNTAVITGARLDRLPGEEGVSLDPRAAIAYRAGDWTLRAGAGLYHQGRWRIAYRVPDAGMPGGIATAARHFAIGAQREGSLFFRVEAFIKSYGDYVEHGEGAQIESGLNRGLDALVRWTAFDRANGWFSYSLLDATVDLADGRQVRAANDVTHTFTGVGKFSVSDAWDVGTTLRLGTGRPLTPVIGGEPSGNGHFRPVLGPVNSDRLPTYFRLDTRLMRLYPVAGRMMVFYVEGLNVLDRQNVLAYSYDQAYRVRRPVRSFFSQRTFVLGVEAQF